jgi:hypothetical protein
VLILAFPGETGGICDSPAGQIPDPGGSWQNCRDSKSRLLLSFQALVFEYSFMTKN